VTPNHHRTGAGPPLVLLHGLGHRWQAWSPVLSTLAGHHDVIAMDLPGFGESPVPPGGMPAGMAATVAALAAIIAEMGLDRPHVAGNSLGGAIALELAAGGHAASATAFSPAGFYTEAEGRRAVSILGMMRATTFQPTVLLRASLRSQRVKARSFGPLVVHPERLSHERAFGDALALRRGSGFRSVVRSAREYAFEGSPDVPVTIAWGSKDHILQPHQAERARERLPKARHVDLPGCGHVPMSDAPDLVARVVLETTGAVAPA
jgi:pimeloyl-ACP methyl ester carboxylesterase